MSDYTPTFDGATKDAAAASGLAADMDQDFTDIETAIATKAETIAGATSGNLIQQDAGGLLVDSGLASANLDNLTGVVQTQLGLRLPVGAAIANHKQSGNFYIRNGSAAYSPFDLSSVSASTHTVIRPSNRGAGGLTWTALDLVPTDAKAIVLATRLRWTSTLTNDTSVELWAYDADLADGISNERIACQYEVDGLTATETNAFTDWIIVPCNSLQQFKVYHSSTQATLTSDFALFYWGFLRG